MSNHNSLLLSSHRPLLEVEVMGVVSTEFCRSLFFNDWLISLIADEAAVEATEFMGFLK